MDGPGGVKERHIPHVPSAGPAIVALVLVVSVAVAMLLWTMYWMHAATADSATLVQNSLRSVELVNELRHEAMRIETEPSPPARSELEHRIKDTMHAYAPLANTPPESAELARLHGLLDRALAMSVDDPGRPVRFEQVQGSLARLVEINERTAHQTVSDIQHSARMTLVVQIIAAVVLLAAASVVGSLLHRVLARQRARVQQELMTLEERNTDLSEFVGRTAHDLRAPLMPIRGYADLLAAGSADVAKAAERIRLSAQRMADILDDLTMLSTSGTLPVGEADAAVVIREVLAELTPELEGAHTRVTVTACKVACAPSVLRQILHNVVMNSCKYRSPERVLVVAVESRCLGDEAVIEVEDNGIGMAPETVARAFEAHYRAPAVHAVHGAGLGLSIVKRMIDVLDGDCELNSEPGRGTRFVMRLPTSRDAVLRAS